MPAKRMPEERIAADLGIDLRDLYRIARAERVRQLAQPMEDVVRSFDRMVRGELFGHEIESTAIVARQIIARLDAPMNGRGLA